MSIGVRRRGTSTRIACSLDKKVQPLAHTDSSPLGSPRPLSAVSDGQCWPWSAAIRTKRACAWGTQINLSAASMRSRCHDATQRAATGTVDAGLHRTSTNTNPHESVPHCRRLRPARQQVATLLRRCVAVVGCERGRPEPRVVGLPLPGPGKVVWYGVAGCGSVASLQRKLVH